MAAALVFELHGCALRQLSDSCEMHFVGLSQAARVARRRGKLSDKLAAKLTKVDVTFAVLRHITTSSAESTIQLLVDELCCSQVSEQEGAFEADSGTAPGGMPCRPGPPQRGSSVRADCDIRSGVPARVPPEVPAPPVSAQLIQTSRAGASVRVPPVLGEFAPPAGSVAFNSERQLCTFMHTSLSWGIFAPVCVDELLAQYHQTDEWLAQYHHDQEADIQQTAKR